LPSKIVLPEVGSKVWIEVKEGGDLQSYTSRVEDIRGDRIVLAAPMYKGTLVKINSGKVNVRFVHKDALYVFESDVLEQRAMPIPSLIVRVPKEVKREQRREYVRVPWLIMAKFLVLSEDEINIQYRDYPKLWEEKLFDIFDGVIKDISGGGIRFNISMNWVKQYDIRVGRYMLVKFSLEYDLLGNHYEREFIEKIKIVRDIPILSKLNAEFGATFIDIPDRDRDFIIKAVLQRQRELIKKGVL